MSPVGKALFEFVPYVIVFLVCAFLPRRQGITERMALGAIGTITSAFIVGLWHGGGTLSIGSGGWVEWPHLLNLIVFLPLLGAVFVLFLPRQSPSLLRGFSLGILLADFLTSLVLLGTPMRSGWHHQFIGDWLPSCGIRYHVAVDGISLWLLLLTTFTTPLAFYAAFGTVRERVKDFCFATLLLHAAILGAYIALDLFLFYAFSELALIAMAFMIGIWGGRERIGAAFKFFLYAFAGSTAMLAAILYLVWSHRQAAGYLTFDYLALSHLAVPRTAAWFCFFAFAFAFAVKVPLFPLHTWLADAFEEAPTFAAIVLSAVMLKLGAYGYLRFCMGMFAGPAWQAGVTFAGLSVVCGVIWGALGAIRQSDIRRLIAYASLAQMGYVMLGVFAATVSSLEGAILQMVSHGISTCALFLLVAIMHERCKSHQLSELWGLAKAMPVYSTVFLIVAMSCVGMPGTSGFVGELLIITGAFVSTSLGLHGPLQATIAAFGGVLAAIYALRMIQMLLFGTAKHPEKLLVADLNARETIVVAPLVALIVIMGWFPRPFTLAMSETVTSTAEHYREGRAAYLGMSPESRRPLLMPRRGGNLERGYPEGPRREAKSVGGSEFVRALSAVGVEEK